MFIGLADVAIPNRCGKFGDNLYPSWFFAGGFQALGATINTALSTSFLETSIPKERQFIMSVILSSK